MIKKSILTIQILISIGYSQILWNEPPDTIWYGNQSRWVEVILPRPKQLSATTTNQNHVKLTLEPYWTEIFISAYLDKFGFTPVLGRHSLYRSGVAIGGISIEDTVYIDSDVVIGETYYYEYMANTGNYLTIGGLQQWSPRSYPTSITVGVSQSNLTYPSNFNGSYNPLNNSINLQWDFVEGAVSYTIFKSLYNTQSHQWEYNDIQHISNNNYQDIDILEYTEYLYSIKSVTGNDHSDRSPPIAISTLSFDFCAPSNFCGQYIEKKIGSIHLSWESVPGADSYEIFKSYIDPETGIWIYRTIETDNLSEYIDVKLLPNQTYFYQILSKCGFVKSERSKTIMVTSGTLNVETDNLRNFQLSQNMPNPFNPTTKIGYSLPIDSQVNIVIYNLLGDKVRTLVNHNKISGNHSISWNGTNDIGDRVVGGVYFYTINAGSFNQTKKMIYLK